MSDREIAEGIVEFVYSHYAGTTISRDVDCGALVAKITTALTRTRQEQREWSARIAEGRALKACDCAFLISEAIRDSHGEPRIPPKAA